MAEREIAHFADLLIGMRSEVRVEAGRLINIAEQTPYADALLRYYTDIVQEFGQLKSIDLATDERGGLVANVADDFKGALWIRAEGDELMVLEIYKGSFVPRQNPPIGIIVAGVFEVDKEAGLHTYAVDGGILDREVLYRGTPQSRWLERFIPTFMKRVEELYVREQLVFSLEDSRPPAKWAEIPVATRHSDCVALHLKTWSRHSVHHFSQDASIDEIREYLLAERKRAEDGNCGFVKEMQTKRYLEEIDEKLRAIERGRAIIHETSREYVEPY